MAAPAIEAGNEAVSFAVSETLTNYNPTALAIGFGDSVSLLPMAPIVLLYSYTRRKKNPLIDTLIPLAGVFVFLMLILQGLYQIMHILPFSGMIDLEEIMSMGSELLSGAVPL